MGAWLCDHLSPARSSAAPRGSHHFRYRVGLGGSARCSSAHRSGATRSGSARFRILRSRPSRPASRRAPYRSQHCRAVQERQAPSDWQVQYWGSHHAFHRTAGLASASIATSRQGNGIAEAKAVVQRGFSTSELRRCLETMRAKERSDVFMRPTGQRWPAPPLSSGYALAVPGPMMAATFVTWSAGKPPSRAWRRIASASSASWMQ